MNLNKLQLLQDDLSLWFESESRDLPWRNSWDETNSPDQTLVSASELWERPSKTYQSYLRDPYKTWISEIMLQQTRVSAVIEYFNRWMEKFPSVQTLASANLDDVLQAWAGLGYYSRARNIHKTATILVENYNSQLPSTRTELLKLPGIGEYTAGAILSLAMGQNEAILDGNCIRVLSRLYRIPIFPVKQAELKHYWSHARDWAKHSKPQIVNEAIMELGAKICTPTNPHCSACPIQKHCPSASAQDFELYPPKKPRAEITKLKLFALVVKYQDEYLLVQNEAFSFLRKNQAPPISEQDWAEIFKNSVNLGQINHKITRYDLNFTIQFLEIFNKKDFLTQISNSPRFTHHKDPIFQTAQKGLGHTKLNEKLFESLM